MTEADLAGLRDEIQTRTLLPSFEDVERRARRRRRRLRLTGLFGVLGLLAVALPALALGGLTFAQTSGRAGLVVSFGAPPVSTGNGNGNIDETGLGPQPGPSGDAPASYRTLLAVDGLSTTQLYGLVDICVLGVCDLQLVTIEWDGNLGRLIFGNLLRPDPRDQVSGVRLAIINQQQVTVSGYINREVQRTTVTVGIPPNDLPTGATMAVPRPVQPEPYGPIKVVSGRDQGALLLAHQPSLRGPQLASTTGGWWVTGTDRTTGRVAVAYSHDNGATWRTSVLGLHNSGGDVELATRDGNDVYVLSSDIGEAYLTVSHNGGRTWQKPRDIIGWSTGNQLGLYVVPRDGSVIVWTAVNGGATYLVTVNDGGSWSGLAGPGNDGAITAIPGGYLALGDDPQESVDGVHWGLATVLGING